VVAERGAVRDAELPLLAGRRPEHGAQLVRAGAWWVSRSLHASVAQAVRGHLEGFHDANPLRPGEELGAVRATVEAAIQRERVPVDPDLVEALLGDLDERGELRREGSIVRLPSHRASLAGHEEELDRLVAAIAAAEPTPPTVDDLLATGFTREVLDAATREGALVRVSREIVLTPGFFQRALDVVREAGTAGVTVSAVRETLGTSRKYAVPLLEHLDERRLTRRVGDVRVALEPSEG
jgi:selenocysteine-specific elongation factor